MRFFMRYIFIIYLFGAVYIISRQTLGTFVFKTEVVSIID